VDSIHEEIIKKELADILGKVHKSEFYKDLTPQQLKYLAVKFAARAERVYLLSSPPEFVGKPEYPNLCWCPKDVLKTVEQVWKRKVYFKVFHKDVANMNELKETALFCFWVLKLHPFYQYGRSGSTNKFNAAMALYILINGVIAYVADMNKKEIREFNKNPTYTVRKYDYNLNLSAIPDLHYSFQFRDWSKEAIMDLAERLIVVE
jgi:hypothetical protein